MRISACFLIMAAGVFAAAGAAKAQSMLSNEGDPAKVGKDFWLTASGKVCSTPVMPHVQCTDLAKGTHGKVDGIARGYTQGIFTRVGTGNQLYHVVLDDGQQGYIDVEWINLLSSNVDPVAAAAECKRRGEPRIGMTVKQLEATCWGMPGHVNRRTTAKGTREQFVYGSGRYVDVFNGVVTSIDIGGTAERRAR